jgi:hypothetical protein
MHFSSGVSFRDGGKFSSNFIFKTLSSLIIYVWSISLTGPYIITCVYVWCEHVNVCFRSFKQRFNNRSDVKNNMMWTTRD